MYLIVNKNSKLIYKLATLFKKIKQTFANLARV